MTTFADGLYQYGGQPVSGVGGGFYEKVIFVKPSTGADGNKGTSPSRAVATIAKALSLVTANKNHAVVLISEGNGASATTARVAAGGLDWNKDGVDLIGVCSGSIQNRARLSNLSTDTAGTFVLTVSANNCRIANVSVYHGHAGTVVAPAAVIVTGERNTFTNCTLSGIGANELDVANAASLWLNGGAENKFVDCYIGLDTVARGTAANCEIRMSGGATRNLFKGCIVATYAEAAGHQFVLVPTAGLDRWTIFDNCVFMNMPTGDASGTTMTEAFDVTGGGSPDGIILLNFCTLVGATDWEASVESGKVMIRTDAGTAATAGLSLDVAAS